jgi:hypothetical protein
MGVSSARTYPLGIVGESNYQGAIERCSPGQAVDVLHEPDNPYDDLALAVVVHGQTIGYIPRECWLQEAIHEEGKGCTASIKSIDRADVGYLAVVLDVSLNADGVRQRAFSREVGRPSRQSSSPAVRKSWLSRLFEL